MTGCDEGISFRALDMILDSDEDVTYHLKDTVFSVRDKSFGIIQSLLLVNNDRYVEMFTSGIPEKDPESGIYHVKKDDFTRRKFQKLEFLSKPLVSCIEHDEILFVSYTDKERFDWLDAHLDL